MLGTLYLPDRTTPSQTRKKNYLPFFLCLQDKKTPLNKSQCTAKATSLHDTSIYAHPFHSTLNMQLTCSYHQNDVKNVFGMEPIFHVNCGKFESACIWKGISCINVDTYTAHTKTTFIALIKFLVDFKASSFYTGSQGYTVNMFNIFFVDLAWTTFFYHKILIKI